jgi:hypothetical protein
LRGDQNASAAHQQNAPTAVDGGTQPTNGTASSAIQLVPRNPKCKGNNMAEPGKKSCRGCLDYEKGKRPKTKGNKQKTAPSNPARECILMADGDLSGKAEATLQHEAGLNTGQQQAGRVSQFSQFTGFGLN